MFRIQRLSELTNDTTRKQKQQQRQQQLAPSDTEITEAMNEGNKDALSLIDKLSMLPSLSRANLVKKDQIGITTLINFDFHGWQGDWATESGDHDENDVISSFELEDISNGILIAEVERELETESSGSFANALSELIVQGISFYS